MDTPAFNAKIFVRPALQFIPLLLMIVMSMMAMVKLAYAVDPPTVPPISGQLTYYGTISGYQCYYPGASPVGPDEAAAALATAQSAGYPTNGFSKLGSGIYDGKRTSWYRETPQTIFPSGLAFAVTQYVCPEGSRNASPPAYNCNGMPNARNNPNECCPCGYVYDAGKSQCVLSNRAGCAEEQYALSLKTDPADKVAPSGSATVTATVKDGQGNGKSGVTVSIKVDVNAGTGGHDHDAGRHVSPYTGTLSAATGTTVADGTVSFTFGAPEVSGTHTFTAKCDSPACTNSPATARIDVKVDGLVPIPASQFYVFIGATDNHSGNHYLTPEAATVLWQMAASYQIENKFWQLKQARKRGQYTYTPSMLYVNDASLIWGGRFDTKGDWATPHAMHRRGVVIDVRANSNTGAIPLSSFTNFKKMAASYGGADAQVHCTSNKTDGQNRQPPSCIGRDGSQDSNRHMHILLLGVDQ